MQGCDRVHLYLARAKHFGRQFIRENQRFTAEMLRPYEYICKNEMHPLVSSIGDAALEFELAIATHVKFSKIEKAVGLSKD